MRETVIVTYSGLRSTGEELEVFEKIAVLDELIPPIPHIRDEIGGFQRALITTSTLEGALTSHYSVSGFFMVYDGKVGQVQFLKELRKWTNEEVRARLRKPTTIERIALQDETGKLVTVKEVIESFYESPEDYLFHAFDETFPRLKRKLERASEEESRIKETAQAIRDEEELIALSTKQ